MQFILETEQLIIGPRSSHICLRFESFMITQDSSSSNTDVQFCYHLTHFVFCIGHYSRVWTNFLLVNFERLSVNHQSFMVSSCLVNDSRVVFTFTFWFGLHREFWTTVLRLGTNWRIYMSSLAVLLIVNDESALIWVAHFIALVILDS